MAAIDTVNTAALSQTRDAGGQSVSADADVGHIQQPQPGDVRRTSADAEGDSSSPIVSGSGVPPENTADMAPAAQEGHSTVHSLVQQSTGQAHLPPAQPSSSTGLAPAESAMATTEPPQEIQQADKTESEKGTVKEKKGKPPALTITTPASRRRPNTKEVSEGAHTASSTTERPSTPRSGRTSPKPPKRSFFSKMARICMFCTRPSAREHDIDVDEGATHLVVAEGQVEEETAKRVARDSEKQHTRESSTVTTVNASPAATLDADVDIIVPPTPSRLLPVSETDGLTSGAVQPPGSTGHDISVEQRTHTSDSAEESDGSFTEEDALKDLLRVDAEAEEQMLIRKGGMGIPMGPDGNPRPLLPPIAPQHQGRKCLVLDLDETLVHSSLRPVPSPDYVVPVEIEAYWHNFYVLKRPGVDSFLKRMGEIYEVVVFTASLSKYADPVLDRLDPDRAVAHRLFRESCYNHRGNYVKDLSQLGRPIAETIIIDNSPASYIFHPHNAVPISSWFNDQHDTELTDLFPFLADLGSASGDVRGILNVSLDSVS